MPTLDQVKNQVRWFIATFGGAVSGFFVGKGWVSAETMTAVLNNEILIGMIITGIASAWGIIAHRQKNMVAVVADMPEVKKVETTATGAGRALADAVPSSAVVAASSGGR